MVAHRQVLKPLGMQWAKIMVLSECTKRNGQIRKRHGLHRELQEVRRCSPLYGKSIIKYAYFSVQVQVSVRVFLPLLPTTLMTFSPGVRVTFHTMRLTSSLRILPIFLSLM